MVFVRINIFRCLFGQISARIAVAQGMLPPTPNPVMKRHIPKYQNDGAKADARPNTKVTKLKVTNGSLLPQISINFPPPRLPSRKPKNVIDPRSPT